MDPACGSRSVCRSDKGSPLNLALGERFCRQSLGCQPLCPKQGIESAEECSAILADPRCVLNIKSSAVIPLAAPNTNRGLLVAMATALLSNIASGDGSASLWLFSLFFHFPAFCSCLLRPHFIFFFLFILRHMRKGNATISFWNGRARGPSPSDKQQVVTEDVLLFPMLSSPQTIKGRFNAWIQHGTNLNDVRLHFSFSFYGLFSSGVTCLQLTPPSARSSLTPTNFKSSFTASIMLLFGLPIGPSGSCYLNLNLSTLV